MRPFGFVSFVCTLLFVVPRTSLRSAVATHVRQPFVFPIVFGGLVWLSAYLRDRRRHALVAWAR